MSNHDGKTAIVTAAGSGIGAATAERLVRGGVFVILSDIDADALAVQKNRLKAWADKVEFIQCDVSDRDQLVGVIESAASRHDGLDILVNNAGMGSFGNALDLDYDNWRRVFAICVDSTFLASKHALPHLIKSQGCIVNTCSISGLYADYGFAAYNAAKGAVANLTRNMALDFGQHNVRVNAVCPGLIVTPLSEKLREHDEIKEEYDRTIPLGRFGDPDEVAAAIAFLASSDASYITGINLVVDGGITAGTGQPNFSSYLKPGASSFK